MGEGEGAIEGEDGEGEGGIEGGDWGRGRGGIGGGGNEGGGKGEGLAHLGVLEWVDLYTHAYKHTTTLPPPPKCTSTHYQVEV